MSRLPRIAVGTIQPGFDPQSIVWALMEALQRAGVQVQTFFSRACFPAHQGAASITGLCPRHLDSWLMRREMCRDLFLRGAESADLALVHGEFGPARVGPRTGGDLETLCRWLDLPRLVAIDGSGIGQCRLPNRPDQADGLLLDGPADADPPVRAAVELEALWAIPVLGVLHQPPRLRALLGRLPHDHRLPRHLRNALGDQFVRYWKPDRILRIACRREMPENPPHPPRAATVTSKLTLAVAYDEALHCYFPDTLEWLERHGASVVDFSPLRDESLPPATDIVYLGCGRPERYAELLAQNHCMKAALGSHLRRGGRIYAEGGGLAYLCQYMETLRGELKRMVGLVPAIAKLRRCCEPAVPVEVTLCRPNWLGETGTRLRGYDNCRWVLEPVGPLADLAVGRDRRPTLVGSFRVVGSLLHLNFAAEPQFLGRFFHPRRPLGDLPDPWSAVI